ncbi:erythromycin esterase family protein [Thalassobacillus sp. C254]|uniref:erythromycin esterase family protein n=1 Tax=Thalassobacillus sp. C254 TaxID=1225341 RepID=UPI0006D23B1D|nr:erythromycin esterase family protein [Thalassobacillus sp. C254]
MQKTNQVVDHIKKYSKAFEKAEDLQPLIEQAAKAKYVLLGEASHGTSEFYTLRSEITKRLIKEHGFSFVAVEGDWPSSFEVNRYVKGYAAEYKNAKQALSSFQRWPSWMWANEEAAELAEWLKNFNVNHKRNEEKAGYYGLDLYSLWESMEAILNYLSKNRSEDVDQAKRTFECFEPFDRKAERYGISAALYGQDCMEEMLELLQTIHEKKETYDNEPEASLNMEINAMAASNAENYYHTMITSDNESWNIRDRHMTEALRSISRFYGKEAKGVIWEHNTHIGDARATDMADEGMVNVGQLLREEYGNEKIYAIGLGTHRGSVTAARKWGEPAEEMTVPEAVAGSWEDLLHQAGGYDKYIMFTNENRTFFQKSIGHRAIGVTYNPLVEHLGNYVPSRLSDRYDAFIHVEKTNPLSPI